ncbi:MAG: hypothetical protein RL499_354, partial [Actinomycetota bacterium]
RQAERARAPAPHPGSAAVRDNDPIVEHDRCEGGSARVGRRGGVNRKEADTEGNKLAIESGAL